ncbi:MAG: hypothetical protein CO135_00775 [Candidatus Levybacteria bacterium CG_4_9_14_3_um_filter_35_16]|nr:MAG: hypothetical protein COW87_00905 [Candidatus Levybacteria bacterium CG22_combo_CG10-13_8_21_14_all_35_11]PJA91491.1 MAG: hypothetical protein CO135_00775 [Candidatus Levybacteria bacterium CG_4_9_14_3_um_filter_35_16]PJC54147.1 MAG: hypothetical protein CO028_04070 [Candidatus Levybacteria bacterium CG_4_9_14_0_2_um_filter_35_21]
MGRIEVIPTTSFWHIKDKPVNLKGMLIPTFSDRVKTVWIQSPQDVRVKHNFNPERSGVFYGESINDANIYVATKIDGKKRRLYFHYSHNPQK